MISLLGKPIKEKIVDDIRSRISKGQMINAYIISNPNSFEASSYKKLVSDLLTKLGIKVTDSQISSQEEAEEAISEANKDKLASVFICRPLMVEDENRIIELVPASADADMLTSVNSGRLYKGDMNYLTGTSSSVEAIIDYYNIPVQGRKVFIIGRSISVGLPIGLMMLKKNGMVTYAHSKISLDDLRQEARKTDILVLASGKRGLIRKEDINPRGIVIDCGYQEDGKGDLGFDPECQMFTPVPGGVGPITISLLILNAFKLKFGE